MNLFSVLVAAKAQQKKCGTGRIVQYKGKKRNLVGTHDHLLLTAARCLLHLGNDHERLFRVWLAWDIDKYECTEVAANCGNHVGNEENPPCVGSWCCRLTTAQANKWGRTCV